MAAAYTTPASSPAETKWSAEEEASTRHFRPVLVRGRFVPDTPVPRSSQRFADTAGVGRHAPATDTHPAVSFTRRLVASVPALRRTMRDAFVALETWEGYVEQVNEDGSFRGRLVSLGPGRGEAFTTFTVDEISDFDQELVTPGAVFYWTIGYATKVAGQREGRSVLRFRRLPVWTEDDLAEVAEESAAVVADLHWDTTDGGAEQPS